MERPWRPRVAGKAVEELLLRVYGDEPRAKPAFRFEKDMLPEEGHGKAFRAQGIAFLKAHALSRERSPVMGPLRSVLRDELVLRKDRPEVLPGKGYVILRPSDREIPGLFVPGPAICSFCQSPHSLSFCVPVPAAVPGVPCEPPSVPVPSERRSSGRTGSVRLPVL